MNRRAHIAAALLAAFAVFSAAAEEKKDDKGDSSYSSSITGAGVNEGKEITKAQDTHKYKTTTLAQSEANLNSAANDLNFAQGEQKIAKDDLTAKTKEATKAKDNLTKAQNDKVHYDNEAGRAQNKSNDFKNKGNAQMAESDNLKKQAAEMRKNNKPGEAAKLESQSKKLEADAKSNFQKSDSYAQKADDFRAKSKAQDGIIAEKQKISDTATHNQKLSQDNFNTKTKNVETKTQRFDKAKEDLIDKAKKSPDPSTKRKILEKVGDALDAIGVGDAGKKARDAIKSGDPEKIENALKDVAYSVADIPTAGAATGARNIVNAGAEVNNMNTDQKQLDNTVMVDGQRAQIVKDLFTQKDANGNHMTIQEANKLADGYMNGDKDAVSQVNSFYKDNDINGGKPPERGSTELTWKEVGEEVLDYGGRLKDNVKNMPGAIVDQAKNTKDLVVETGKDLKDIATMDDATMQQLMENKLTSGAWTWDNVKEGLDLGKDKVKDGVGGAVDAAWDWTKSWWGGDKATTERENIINSLMEQGATKPEAEKVAWQYQFDKNNNPGGKSTAITDFKNDLRDQGRLIDKETGEKVPPKDDEKGGSLKDEVTANSDPEGGKPEIAPGSIGSLGSFLTDMGNDIIKNTADQYGLNNKTLDDIKNAWQNWQSKQNNNQLVNTAGETANDITKNSAVTTAQEQDKNSLTTKMADAGEDAVKQGVNNAAVTVANAAAENTRVPGEKRPDSGKGDESAGSNDNGDHGSNVAANGGGKKGGGKKGGGKKSGGKKDGGKEDGDKNVAKTDPHKNGDVGKKSASSTGTCKRCGVSFSKIPHTTSNQAEDQGICAACIDEEVHYKYGRADPDDTKTHDQSSLCSRCGQYAKIRQTSSDVLNRHPEYKQLCHSCVGYLRRKDAGVLDTSPPSSYSLEPKSTGSGTYSSSSGPANKSDIGAWTCAWCGKKTNSSVSGVGSGVYCSNACYQKFLDSRKQSQGTQSKMREIPGDHRSRAPLQPAPDYRGVR